MRPLFVVVVAVVFVIVFQRGDNNEIVKVHGRNLKLVFSRTIGPISIILSTKHSGIKGIKVCSNKMPALFTKEKMA